MIPTKQTTKRKFKAVVNREENETSIGITEYSGRYTKAIASIYIEKPNTNREAFEVIADHMYARLEPDELSEAYIHGISLKKELYPKYDNRIRFNKTKYSPRMEEARTLADDALKRQTDIKEVFEESIETYNTER